MEIGIRTPPYWIHIQTCVVKEREREVNVSSSRQLFTEKKNHKRIDDNYPEMISFIYWNYFSSIIDNNSKRGWTLKKVRDNRIIPLDYEVSKFNFLFLFFYLFSYTTSYMSL